MRRIIFVILALIIPVLVFGQEIKYTSGDDPTPTFTTLTVTGATELQGTVNITGTVTISTTITSSSSITLTRATLDTFRIMGAGGSFLEIEDNNVSLLDVEADGDFNFDVNTLFVDVGADAIGLGTTTPAANFHLQPDSSSSLVRLFMIEDTTGQAGDDIDTAFVVMPDGKVGIGTASPSEALHLVTGGVISEAALKPGLDGLYVETTGSYVAEFRGTGVFAGFLVRNDKSGGGGIPFVQLLSSVSDDEWTILLHTDDSFRFLHGDAEGENVLTLDNTGNVGIGTTAPQHDLSLYSTDPTFTLTDTDINLNVSSAAEAIDTSAVFGSIVSNNGRISVVSDVGETGYLGLVDGGANADTVVIQGDAGLAFRFGNNSLIVGIDGAINFSDDLDVVDNGTFGDIIVDEAAGVIDGTGATSFTLSSTGSGQINIADNLQMDNDALIKFDVNTGITAGTTQTQAGATALTAQTNNVTTVGTDGDGVKLVTAIVGVFQEIHNAGANTIKIYPNTSDDLGAGVDLPEELEANESVRYIAVDTTTWIKESSTEIIHATMLDEDNTDVFVINDAGADFHSYHTNGLVAGDLADWAFDAGGGGTSFPIESIANAGDDITVETTGTHGLAVGDIVSQTNLADAAYVGIFDVLTVPSDTTYTVTANYTATGTGTMDQAAVLTADPEAASIYSVTWGMSGTSSTNNETFDFRIYKNATRVVGMNGRRKFGTANDFGMGSPGTTTVSIASGDKISFALSNEDSAGNITIRNFTVYLEKL